MLNEIIVRPIKRKDVEQYINLKNIVWRNAYSHIFPEEVFLLREKSIDNMVKDFLNNDYINPMQFNYVAEHNGRIVGILSGKLHSDYEYFKMNNYAELMAVYILPEYQGKGIASRLKNLFIDWLKENNVKKYVIGVLRDNRKARDVYENWGCELSDYSQPFVKLGVEYSEVFYTSVVN